MSSLHEHICMDNRSGQYTINTVQICTYQDHNQGAETSPNVTLYKEYRCHLSRETYKSIKATQAYFCINQGGRSSFTLTRIWRSWDNLSVYISIGSRAVPVVASISIYLIAIHRYLYFSILLVCSGKSNTYLLD